MLRYFVRSGSSSGGRHTLGCLHRFVAPYLINGQPRFVPSQSTVEEVVAPEGLLALSCTGEVGMFGDQTGVLFEQPLDEADVCIKVEVLKEGGERIELGLLGLHLGRFDGGVGEVGLGAGLAATIVWSVGCLILVTALLIIISSAVFSQISLVVVYNFVGVLGGHLGITLTDQNKRSREGCLLLTHAQNFLLALFAQNFPLLVERLPRQ
mmetsp:Transcript_7128/g.19884  ORF Transcript_7128/g.19884 Transcript_7128/m.19884 type:complete len:209 (-) Transcript_7128:344-970(-)